MSHVDRAEFYDQLGKFTQWVAEQNQQDRHRLSRLETDVAEIRRQAARHQEWMEKVMGIITDDLAQLEGIVQEAESALAGQETLIKQQGDRIAQLEAAGNPVDPAAAADHQELVDGHTRLAQVIAGLREAVEAAKPANPSDAAGVVPPAPGSTVADPTSPAAPGGPLDPGTPVDPGVPVQQDPEQPGSDAPATSVGGDDSVNTPAENGQANPAQSGDPSAPGAVAGDDASSPSAGDDSAFGTGARSSE